MTNLRLNDLEERRSRLRQWVRGGTSASVETRGVNHIAVFAKDLEATARFYQEVLGLPVLNVVANRMSRSRRT